MLQEFRLWGRCIVITRCWGSGFTVAILTLLLLGPSPWATAQEAGKAKPVAYEKYDVIEAMRDANVRKEKKSNKEGMLKGSVAYNRQEIDAYYKGYLLPMLTLTSAPEYGNIARTEILSDIDRAEKANEAVLNEFNSMLLAEMRKIAEGNYQPSASIIATQILGRLNKSRPRGFAPEPLLATVGPLLGLVENGRNDGIRAAALAQLERHIDYYGSSWPDANRQVLADRLLASLKAARPASRSPRADAWLRGRTIELLLKIRHAKEPELYQYAIDVLANSNTEPILIEKALLVTGQYPQAPIAPNLANPAVSNPLQLLVSRVTSWKKDVGEQFQAGGGGGEDSGTDVTGDEGNAEMIDDGSGDGEGMVRKAPKKKAEPKVNPYAKQAADVINKRRALHETLEVMRYGYTGSRIGPLPTDSKAGLALQLPEGDTQEVMTEVMNTLIDLQDAINSPTITDRLSLSNEAFPKADALINAVEYLLNNLTQPTQAPPAEPTPAS
jgi:hypothetical protein